MKYLLIFVVVFSLSLCSCNNNSIGTNADGNKVFTYEPIGWQMTLPQGWGILTETERDKMVYAAENYYEEDNQNNNKSGGKKIILGVQKGENDVNSCYAFVRSYNRDEDYPELRDLLNQQYRAYSTGDYSAEAALTEEVISDITFEKAVLTVQYNGRPYFTYITYSTMLDTLNFGVSIISNNTDDEQLLTEHFRNSVHTIKKL